MQWVDSTKDPDILQGIFLFSGSGCTNFGHRVEISFFSSRKFKYQQIFMAEYQRFWSCVTKMWILDVVHDITAGYVSESSDGDISRCHGVGYVRYW